MTITYDTNEYEFSHGRKPKGFGSWAFEVDLMEGATPLTWWFNQSTLTDAKKKMNSIIREALPKSTVVYVKVLS
jgi:hypothetical protein